MIARQGHQQQRRLADAGLAADEHERGRDEPAAEHAVELGDAGRDPLGLLGLDVDEAEQGPRARGAPRRGVRPRLLDERPELAAAGAAAEPAARRVSALGAGEEGRGGLGHETSVGAAADVLVCRERADTGRTVRPFPACPGDSP